MKSVDALFYFIFRFVQSINVEEDILKTEDNLKFNAMPSLVFDNFIIIQFILIIFLSII